MAQISSPEDPGPKTSHKQEAGRNVGRAQSVLSWCRWEGLYKDSHWLQWDIIHKT